MWYRVWVGGEGGGVRNGGALDARAVVRGEWRHRGGGGSGGRGLGGGQGEGGNSGQGERVGGNRGELDCEAEGVPSCGHTKGGLANGGGGRQHWQTPERPQHAASRHRSRARALLLPGPGGRLEPADRPLRRAVGGHIGCCETKRASAKGWSTPLRLRGCLRPYFGHERASRRRGCLPPYFGHAGALLFRGERSSRSLTSSCSVLPRLVQRAGMAW